MKSKKSNDKYMGSAKVGPKGQIVIPKEIRDMFGIKPGDTLIILADESKGIAIERYSTFAKIADAIFENRTKGVHPDEGMDDSLEFASAIKEMED